MSFESVTNYIPRKQIIWQHHWSDGSRLELTQDKYDWILIEYDADGEPIQYAVQDGYSQSTSVEERSSKKQWSLRDAIADIKEEYDMEG